jgi:hypothetical protein
MRDEGGASPDPSEGGGVGCTASLFKMLLSELLHSCTPELLKMLLSSLLHSFTPSLLNRTEKSIYTT